jgi:hypothetical protein
MCAGVCAAGTAAVPWRTKVEVEGQRLFDVHALLSRCRPVEPGGAGTGGIRRRRCRLRRIGRLCRQRQRALDRMEHELMHGTRIAEADLGLGRMDIHVDGARVEFDEHRVGRMTRTVQHVGVRLAQGMRQQAVAHEAAIDEAVLGVASGTREGRLRHETGDADLARIGLDRARVLHEFVAEQRTHAGRHVGGRQPLREPAVVLQLECHLRYRQRNAAEHVVAVAVLGLFGTQEFPPRRGVVIEVGDIDDSAGIESRRLGVPAVVDAPGVRRCRRRGW